MGSKKNTAQSSDQKDQRVVADKGIGLSGSSGNAIDIRPQSADTLANAEITGSGNVINMTDAGLIKAAFDYLEEADAANTDRLDKVLNSGRDILDAAGAVSSAAVSAGESVASGTKTVVILAGLGVAGALTWAAIKGR